MRTKTKILIFIPLWKRIHITEICFLGIERMRTHPDFDIQVLCVVSEDEMVPLCEKYKASWIRSDNFPLGRKKNAGLKIASRFDFDYLMEMGSDTLVLNELLDEYTQMKDDFFGVNDIALICSETGECRRFRKTNTVFGGGRMISRKVLEKHDWTLFPDDLSRAMDNSSFYKISVKGGTPYRMIAPDEFPKVIDLKSEVNLWPFNHYAGQKYDAEEIYKRISEPEKQMIDAILQAEYR